jgi:hypothetical protein
MTCPPFHRQLLIPEKSPSLIISVYSRIRKRGELSFDEIKEPRKSSFPGQKKEKRKERRNGNSTREPEVQRLLTYKAINGEIGNIIF